MANSSNAAEWAVQLRAIQRAFSEREDALVRVQASTSESLKQLGAEKSALERQVKALEQEVLDSGAAQRSLGDGQREALETLNRELAVQKAEAEARRQEVDHLHRNRTMQEGLHAKMRAEWEREKTDMTTKWAAENVAMQARREQEMAYERHQVAALAAGLSTAIRGLRDSVAAMAEGASWRPSDPAAPLIGRQVARPENVEQLLLVYDEEFIEAAYRAVLDRAADDTGRSHYLGALRQGTEKESILVELATSEEGLAKRTNFPGLEALVAAHAARRPTFFQRAARKLTARDQNEVARQERRLVNQMHAIERRTLEQLKAVGEEVIARNVDPVEAVYFRDLDVRLADMDRLVRGLTALGSPSGTRAASQDIVSSVTPGSAGRPMASDKAFQALSSPESPHADFIKLSAEMTRSARFGTPADSPEGRRSIANFMTGTHPDVEEPDGPVRWMGAEASAFLHVSAAELCVAGAGVFEDRLIDVVVGEQRLATLHFGPQASVARCSVAGLVGQDVEFVLRSDATFCPLRHHDVPDHRELGLKIHNIYFS